MTPERIKEIAESKANKYYSENERHCSGYAVTVQDSIEIINRALAAELDEVVEMIKNSYQSAYEKGHNDTVESNYCGWEMSWDDYYEEELAVKLQERVNDERD